MIPTNSPQVRKVQAKWFECGDFLQLENGIYAETQFFYANETAKTVQIQTTNGIKKTFAYHDLLTYQQRLS